MLARLVGAVLTIAVPMVLARVLVPASYGTFKQAWLLSQTLALILPFGLTQSLYYFVPREPPRRDRFVAQALWFHLAIAAAAAIAILAGRSLVARQFGNAELDRNLGWVAAFTALFIAGQPLDVAWNATGKFGRAALLRAGFEGARGLGMVGGALATRSVEGIFVGIAVACGLRAALAWAAIARAHGLRADRALFRRQAAYALPFGVAFLLIIPQQQFHQYAVGAAVSAAAFAVYSVGCFQLPIVDVLYTPVSELLQIGLAEADRDGRGARGGLALFHEAVLQLAFVFVPAAGFLLLAAPELIRFLFSARYAAATPIFRLALIQIALSALPLDGVMRARAQNRFMVVLSAAKLAITIPLVLAGLRALGPIGALAGFVAAESATRVAMLARSAALFESGAAGILPLGALGRQAASTAAAMPPAWIVLRALGGPLAVRLAVAGSTFAAAYLGVSLAVGALPAGWASLFRRTRPVAVPSRAREPAASAR